MKLYKFRPLASCKDLSRIEEILQTGKFWCSRFWELNDPMEGVYWFNSGSLSNEVINKLYSDKSNKNICSFSGKEAFEKPIMWGYYANGFKGVAIEIEVDDSEVCKVDYPRQLTTIAPKINIDKAVHTILTTKLKCWVHEEEYRYIKSGQRGLHQIGEITGVFFGRPYKTTVNAVAAQSRPMVKQYLQWRESLTKCAKSLNIPCHEVEIDDGKVTCSAPVIGMNR